MNNYKLLNHFPYLKKILLRIKRRINRKFNSRIYWDKELLKDLAEYYHLSEDEAKSMSKLGRRLFCDFWKTLTPTKETDVLSFYKMPFPFDVFSLAHWHMTGEQKIFRKKIVANCSGDVLDYGGGIGDLSLKIADKGLDVTYVDLNCENMNFARYRSNKNGYKIQILDAEKDQGIIWEKKYDTIVCLDVIEHIPNPETVLENFCHHLRIDGKLIITGLDCTGPAEDAPMHLKINFDAEKLLNQFGLFSDEVHSWLWLKETESSVILSHATY